MLFVSATPLAGMPWRTMKVCNRFLEEDGGWAKPIIYDERAYGKRMYPPGISGSPSEIDEIYEEADVVILSSYMGKEHARGRPYTRHYSTEPFRWVEQSPEKHNSTVVAQYQARFAEHLDVLPNAIPIDNPLYKPGIKSDEIINIVYSPTSRVDEGWANKSYKEVMLVFRQILNDLDLKNKVNIYLLENAPHETVMAARRKAHIVIDECSTGSYHSTTLEGLSCGASVLVWIDADTQFAIKRLFEKDISFPVIQSLEKELYPNLRMLIENPTLLKSNMKESRKWMEKHYSEQWQAGKWIKWHQHFLLNSKTKLTN